DTQPTLSEPFERLGAGDLVDQVEVDADDARGTGLPGHPMLIPDLLDERAGGAVQGGGVVGHGSLGGGGASTIGHPRSRAYQTIPLGRVRTARPVTRDRLCTRSCRPPSCAGSRCRALTATA